MNKIRPFAFICFWILLIDIVHGQKFDLDLIGLDSVQTVFLKKISFVKTHSSQKDIQKEIHKIHTELKKTGFFTAMLDTILVSESQYVAQFDIGTKINELSIVISDKLKDKYHFLKTNTISLKPEMLEDFTNSILSDLDKKGHSFSEIRYNSPEHEGTTLKLKIEILESPKRYIDKIIVRGYDDFPRKFIPKFFKIKRRAIFSKQKMEQVSQFIRSLDFVQEKKRPEVLFKKDSTHLYLFLQKKETSTFDGLIGFASREKEQEPLLNGNIDVRLNNIFNSGEHLMLFWNRVSKEKSEFKLNATIPYLFNSWLTTQMSFDLYRQDSTFLNTRFNFRTAWDLGYRSNVAISYLSEQSTHLLQDSQGLMDSYSSHFMGLAYQLQRNSETNIFRNRYRVNFDISTGKRKTVSTEERQVVLNFSSLLNVKVNEKSYVHLKSRSGFLSSKNFLPNELFRIGGVRSVRGFDEQSIFTNLYTYVNLEYRYFLSSEAHLYSVTDMGMYRNTILSTIEKMLGLGAGYEFQLENSRINLSYVIGSNPNGKEKNNPSKLILKVTSFF